MRAACFARRGPTDGPRSRQKPTKSAPLSVGLEQSRDASACLLPALHSLLSIAMPFRRMKLRGQLVWARCDERGELIEEGGRVEIRYREGDGKAYAAARRNLAPADGSIRPDSDFGEAESQASTKSQQGASSSARRTPSSPAGGYPELPEKGETLAYADGACKGNPGPAGLGVVLIDEEARYELAEYLGQGTNNIAELTAILRAIEKAEPGKRLRVFTDSTYSIGVLQKNWKAKKNVELIASIREAMRKHGAVELHYVKGHAGIPLNERVDELAVGAIVARSSSGWQRVKR